MSEPAALDLAAILNIHRRRESVGFDSPDWCDECCTDWPCVYAAAVDELEPCRAERDALRELVEGFHGWAHHDGDIEACRYWGCQRAVGTRAGQET